MDSAGGCKAIHPWHRQIQDYNIRIECGRLSDHLNPIRCLPADFPFGMFFKCLAQSLQYLRTVIGDKYPGSWPSLHFATGVEGVSGDGCALSDTLHRVAILRKAVNGV
jgi:hypothetical protein